MTELSQVALAIEGERLLRLFDSLSMFGSGGDGGIDRQALTGPDLAARRLVVDEMRSIGAEVLRDEAANLFFRWPGTEESYPVATGSHLDSQPGGGAYDGAYGVCAAVEILRALAKVGHHPRHPIEGVVWTNEEGTRFRPGTMGSASFVEPGLFTTFLAARDADGITFAEALRDVDTQFQDVPIRSFSIPFRAFVEIHIEQGPMLERAGISLGLVRGVQGTRWFEFRVTGRAAHAGTTPLEQKHDAVMAALEVADHIYRILREGDDLLRLTIGRFVVSPNSVNVVPAQARFTVDLRHPQEYVLDAVEQDLRALARPTVGCSVEVDRKMVMAPVRFDDQIIRATVDALQAWKLPYMELDSGAFHDSSRLARHCPTGMIFVPSIGGESHCPSERTNASDLVLGTQVLAETLLRLADEPLKS